MNSPVLPDKRGQLMAKRNENLPPSKGKIKIRYFEVDVDGDTEAIQDGIRALTTALSRPASSGTVKVVSSGKSPALLEGAQQSDDLSEDQELPELGEEPTEERAIPVTRKQPKPRSAPTTPNILDGLDFESGDTPWKAFAAQKAPDSDMQKIAVLATWFKRYRNLNQITIHHAYTAYKFAGWSTPNDIGQCFRNAKRTHDWFKTDGAGNWEINIIGLNHVEDKMGKGKG